MKFSERHLPALLLALPSLLIVLLLLALGHIGAGSGFFLSLFAVAGGYLMQARQRRAAARLVREIDTLEDDGPELSADGPLGAVSAAVNRLRRKSAERAATVEDSALLAGAALDALPDPALIAGEGRHVIRANAASRELLGVADNLSSLLRQPEVLEAVDAALAGTLPDPVSYTQPGKVERFIRARALPFSAAGGGENLVLLTLQDITEATRANQMRADFVANASHELRTPLATLVGYTETLLGSARGDEKATLRFLGIMSDQAKRMGQLIDDLLSLSKIELTEHRRPEGAASVADIIGTAASGVELKAAENGVTIRRDVPGDLAPVAGDSLELSEVFQNLLENAVKYGGRDSTVNISARLADGAVQVAVSDEGEGIAKEHLPRLTERFYRVDTARSRAMGGTGLGLAIVKHIVARHHGDLSIESEPGKGSTFTVTLPLFGAD